MPICIQRGSVPLDGRVHASRSREATDILLEVVRPVPAPLRPGVVAIVLRDSPFPNTGRVRSSALIARSHTNHGTLSSEIAATDLKGGPVWQRGRLYIS